MARNSIASLKVYGLALSLEDQVYQLVKKLGEEHFYELGNNLRRSSSAIAHYIQDAHDQYSYALKIESLHSARRAAEETIKLLEQFEQTGFGKTAKLAEQATTIIKQSWGLIKYLQTKRAEKMQQASSKAKDELVAARS